MNDNITYKKVIADQIRNQHIAERQSQHALARNIGRTKTQEFNDILVSTANQSGTMAVKRRKSKLFIKNMVSIRCKMVVGEVLDDLGLQYDDVKLGEVEFAEPLTEKQCKQFAAGLLRFGFELINDKKHILVEQVKNAVVQMIHYEDELPKTNFSDHLSEKLHYDYTYLSNLFSKVKGISIEHFIIIHKIERAKELIVYENLTLSEIAFKLHYSSVGHLSRQFKKITGLTPRDFKKMKHKTLIALEDL